MRATEPIQMILINQVAERLGVSIWTVQRYVKAGLFNKPVYYVPGAPPRWRASDVDEFVHRQARCPSRKLQGNALRLYERAVAKRSKGRRA